MVIKGKVSLSRLVYHAAFSAKYAGSPDGRPAIFWCYRSDLHNSPDCGLPSGDDWRRGVRAGTQVLGRCAGDLLSEDQERIIDDTSGIAFSNDVGKMEDRYWQRWASSTVIGGERF